MNYFLDLIKTEFFRYCSLVRLFLHYKFSLFLRIFISIRVWTLELSLAFVLRTFLTWWCCKHFLWLMTSQAQDQRQWRHKDGNPKVWEKIFTVIGHSWCFLESKLNTIWKCRFIKLQSRGVFLGFIISLNG